MRVIHIAAALLHDGAGRLLLVRKHGTVAFMQPGGKIEPGETPVQPCYANSTKNSAFRPCRVPAGF
ncbi:NUDIX domain-containing protein [Asaia platycodi]|uniref:NUDIX domain-containing protein n=1 Tax=Asaia platycodi TaxID=610243 RepID=UPI000AEBF58A